jgi:hypothetical protein
MNIEEAGREILINADAGNSTLLVGESGVGKSQKIYQTFQKLKAAREKKGERWGFGQIFAATQTPPDIIGFQFKGQKTFELGGNTHTVTVTDPSVPLWMISTEGLPAFAYDKFFLNIEEYGQGEADVKRAIAEIFLNGGSSPWYLPPGSIRVASTNEGSRHGVTKDFDFAIARRTKIHVRGDVRSWLNWANAPYHFQGRDWLVQPVVKAWAETNPQILFEDPPKEQGPWGNPRSITATDRYLQVKAEHSGGQLDLTDPTIVEMMAGTIGMPAATSLMNHLQFRLELPPYEDVVQDPGGTKLPDRADLKMLMAYELASKTEVSDLGPVLSYVKRLPADMSITFVSALLRRDYNRFINEPAMQGWISKNAALVSIIASLSQN